MAARERRMRRYAASLVVAGFAILLFSPFGLFVGFGAAVVGVVVGLTMIAVGAIWSLTFDRPLPELPARRHTVALYGSVAGDNLLLWMVRQESRWRESPDWPAAVQAIQASIARREGASGGPVQTVSAPPQLTHPRLTAARRPHFGRFEHMTFESEFESLDRDDCAAYTALGRNRTGHAYVWRHNDGPRPMLVCLHGYRMGVLELDEVGYSRRGAGIMWLHRKLGLDVVSCVLPLHGPRRLDRRSGEGFLERHPLWTLAALEQAVWDVRRVVGWARGQGAPSIGVLGMSLGGLVASLVASSEVGLSCAIPIIPAVRLSQLVWQQMPAEQYRQAHAAGCSLELLDRSWASVNPLLTAPKVLPQGRLIIAGVGDRIVPPEQPFSLWKHWQEPAIYWYNGGHLAWTGKQSLRTMVESHLRMTLLCPTA